MNQEELNSASLTAIDKKFGEVVTIRKGHTESSPNVE